MLLFRLSSYLLTCAFVFLAFEQKVSNVSERTADPQFKAVLADHAEAKRPAAFKIFLDSHFDHVMIVDRSRRDSLAELDGDVVSLRRLRERKLEMSSLHELNDWKTSPMLIRNLEMNLEDVRNVKDALECKCWLPDLRVSTGTQF